jgi:hypothetical protein
MMDRLESEEKRLKRTLKTMKKNKWTGKGLEITEPGTRSDHPVEIINILVEAFYKKEDISRWLDEHAKEPTSDSLTAEERRELGQYRAEREKFDTILTGES